MILLVGASASGKTEVAKMLAQKYRLKKVVTHTTRPMRASETNGVDYHFVTLDQMKELIARGYFVETTVYNGNMYGTSKPEITYDKVLIVDPNGYRSFLALKDKRIVTFLLTASETTRLNRMLYRGDALDEAKKRIANDRKQFADGQLPKTDFTIDSEKISIEEAADLVYRYYTNKRR